MPLWFNHGSKTEAALFNRSFTAPCDLIEMELDKTIKAALKREKRGGRCRPVIHVLMPDGRVTEFKDKGIVLPEPGDDDKGIFAALINSDGDVFVTPDGDPAIVSVPVVALSTLADPNQAIVGWPKIAKHLGVSPKTAERMEKDGRLPEAYRPSPRKPTYRREQLDAYLEQKRR